MHEIQRRRLRQLTTACCGLSLLVAVLCWMLIRFAAERWWPATVLLFGPKWLLAVGAGVALLMALVGRQVRSMLLAGTALAVCVFPIMGFSLPHRAPALDSPANFHLRVLSDSANGVYVDGPNWTAFDSYFKTRPADVVALQEWGGGPTGPVRLYEQSNGHVCADNELWVWSRYPIKFLGPLFDSPGWARGRANAYELATPAGPVVLVNLHLASPHDAFRAVVHRTAGAAAMVQSNSDDRLSQAAAVAQGARRLGPRVILVGDFNLPAEGQTFTDDFGFLRDTISQSGWGFGWTYRRRGVAARIDHILTGSAWTCRMLSVEPVVWSPHSRLIADLELGAAH